MSIDNTTSVYSDEVIQFVIAATEYCSFVESIRGDEDLAKVLPRLMEVSAQVSLRSLKLPHWEEGSLVLLERFVTEHDYERIRTGISGVFAGADIFLDTELHEMKYSDTPVSVSLSESLTDVYQALANAVGLFRTEVESSMRESIAEVFESFRYEWGAKLLAAQRRMHELYFLEELSSTDSDDDEAYSLDDDYARIPD